MRIDIISVVLLAVVGFVSIPLSTGTSYITMISILHIFSPSALLSGNFLRRNIHKFGYWICSYPQSFLYEILVWAGHLSTVHKSFLLQNLIRGNFFTSIFTELDAALVGLALTYITSLMGMLQYTVRQSAEVENIVSTVVYESYGSKN